MRHVILLGDSIFDNAGYVPGGPAVIEQLRRELPTGWQATLLAVDGSSTEYVPTQLQKLPTDASHLVVSVGGNDALGHAHLLNHTGISASEGFEQLGQAQDEFREQYRAMLTQLATLHKPTVLCTVYDAVPGLDSKSRAALSVFNDVIQQETFRVGLPLIDLRMVCSYAADYSTVSPIEPSRVGGAKIAATIARVIREHDFSRCETAVYGL
jgi:lysophospholipase L1-like esterase